MSALQMKVAYWTQLAAQVSTAWILVLKLIGIRGIAPLAMIFVLIFYGVALMLPLKTDGTLRDRAIACMGSGAMMATALGMQLAGILLGLRLTPTQLLTLLAMVLFTVSGSLYWLNREDD